VVARRVLTQILLELDLTLQQVLVLPLNLLLPIV